MQESTYFVNGSDSSYFFWNIEGGRLYEDGNKTAIVKWQCTAGIYTISVIERNQTGCYGDEQFAKVLVRECGSLFVPNAFAPDDTDPDLNRFTPKGQQIKSYTLEILDHFSHRVFFTNKLIDGRPAESWDGTYEGRPMPQGNYLWVIHAIFEDGSVWYGSDNGSDKPGYMGKVALIR